MGGEGGWARRSRAGCDNLTQRQFDALTLYAVRQYVTLTQRTAVRCYVTLTSELRGVVNYLLEFFGLVASCPRLAGRLCLYP